jgi:D-alanine-D-alanine ligase
MSVLNIAVFLGGPSAERDVSLRTGRAVAQALTSLGHRVTEIDPVPGRLELPAGTDVVFLALHGTYGEDGLVQHELDALGVPYTGCDAVASRIAFDKVLTKLACLRDGVPTSPFAVLHAGTRSWPAGMRPPVVMKPVRQGSSVGLYFLDDESGMAAALDGVLKHDTEALMEARIVGRETTVGIVDGKALPVVEVRPRQGIYDYTNKYTSGATEYLCPAPFDEATTRRIQAAGLGAFRAIGGRDYARVDVMVTPDGEPVVLEVNTLPGMTETSLLPKAAVAAGIAYPDLCQRMVDLALRRKSESPATLAR